MSNFSRGAARTMHEYLETLPGFHTQTGEEVSINCLKRNCGDVRSHLWFNTQIGLGYCYKCRSRWSMTTVIQVIEGLPRPPALMRAKQLGFVENPLLRPRLEETDLDKFTLPQSVDLEKLGFMKAAWNEIARTYLHNRGVSYQQMWEFNIQFGINGKYRGRIGFPIEMFGRCRGFVSRDLAPKGSWRIMSGLSRDSVIYNFDVCRNSLHIVLVEGPFDVIHMPFVAGGLLSNNISDKQIALLRCSKVETVYVMLDSDAGPEAAGVCRKLLPYFHVMLCPIKGDPTDVPQERLRTLLRCAKPYDIKESFNFVATSLRERVFGHAAVHK